MVRRLSILGLLGLTLVGLAGLAGCQVDVIDHGRTPCNAQTCLGCCTSNGVCLAGEQPFACGANAAACLKCADAFVCQEGACVDPSMPDGGPPPDAGTAECGPSNCFGCCSAEGDCMAFTQQGTAVCGSGGEACGACTEATAVCDLGACVVPACSLRVTHPSYGHPEEVDFGPAPVGSTARIDVMLENTGEAACTVQAPEWLADTDRNAFGFDGQAVHALRIEPLASARLSVSFTPYSAQTWNDVSNAFTFVANDGAPSQCVSGERGCRRKIVRGQGVASELPPSVLVSPASLSLGEVAVGCRSPWRTVMVVNAASFPVTVDVALQPGPFELQAIGLPLQLPARGAFPIRLRALPQAVGALTGALTLTDSISGTRTVPLSAEGVADAQRVLEVTIPSPADMDVLVVMHNGAGMATVQSELAAAAQAFVQRAQSAGGAYRVGVVTSDASQASAGLLQGSPKYISASTSGGLGAHFEVGQTGGIDQSLEAARLAVFPPIRSDPLRNGSFFRSGYRTGVVFASNAEEKSGGGLLDYVGAVREATGPVRFEDGPKVVGLLANGQCASGSRWQEGISLFGGSCFAIGSGGASDALAQAADALFVPVREVALSSPVDAQQPVRVMVDGTELDAPGSFTVDVAKGSVRFAPAWVPPPGTQVRVEWRAACQP